jgi:hypothetical protein
MSDPRKLRSRVHAHEGLSGKGGGSGIESLAFKGKQEKRKRIMVYVIPLYGSFPIVLKELAPNA